MSPVRKIALGIVALLWGLSANATEVRRQLLAEPESLDPQLITGSTDFDVVEDLFEGLTAQGPDGATVPGAAEHWEVGADRLTWVFHLRQGLKWSDGSDLTAADFVWAMRRAVTPATASPYAAALAPIRNAREIAAGTAKPETLGVTAPDPATVRIVLREPAPFLPDLMWQPIAYPLPHAVIEHWGNAWARPGHMVSDGAFTLASWVPQSQIVLDRNPQFHAARADGVDHVDWLLADDRRAGLRRYRAGELDAAALAAEDYSWALQNRPTELHSTPLFATRYLVVGMAHGPLAKDGRLRAALSMAIDRDLLVDKIDTRGQRAAWGFVPPGLGDYKPQSYPYRDRIAADRQALARQMFDAATAGQPMPFKITLLLEHDDIDHRIAAALRAMWQAALPVEVTLQEPEWRVYDAQYRSGNFDVTLAGWYADYADAWNFLANWRSDAGPLNPGGYHSAAYDGLLDQAKQADGPSRLTAMEAAERQLLADHPVIPIEFVVSQKLVNPRLHGWAADPFDMNLSRYLSLAN